MLKIFIAWKDQILTMSNCCQISPPDYTLYFVQQNVINSKNLKLFNLDFCWTKFHYIWTRTKIGWNLTQIETRADLYNVYPNILSYFEKVKIYKIWKIVSLWNLIVPMSKTQYRSLTTKRDLLWKKYKLVNITNIRIWKVPIRVCSKIT